jgi:hypothetical protein
MRKLVPAFMYLGRVLAWQCDACHKLFVNTPEEAGSATVPSHWTHIRSSVISAPPAQARLRLKRTRSYQP